jgi:hypothetical protein
VRYPSEVANYLQTERLTLRPFTADDVDLLRHAAWGHGYATEGTRAVVRRAFAVLGVERVQAETMFVDICAGRTGSGPPPRGPLRNVHTRRHSIGSRVGT